MVTDEQRGRYGRWLRRERLALGWSVDEARARLARLGYRIGESSYAEWESGRKRPSRDALPHLVALFGEPDPEAPPQPEPAQGGDVAALVAEMREQNRVSRDLAAAVFRLADAIDRGQRHRPEWAGEALREVLAAIRLRPGLLASDAPAPSAAPPRGPAR